MKLTPNKIAALQSGKSIISEDKLQENCVNWFRAQYPQYYLRLFAIPNGGMRDRKTVVSKKTGKISSYSPAAVKLKKTGLLPGVYDLLLSIPRHSYCGLFIESKVGINDLSDEQILFMNANKPDYFFVTCWNIDVFINIVNWYLKG